MPITIEKVTEAALRLAPRDRALLAHRLISSLDEPADEGAEPAWDEEIQKRLQEIKDGQVRGQDFDEAMNESRRERETLTRNADRLNIRPWAKSSSK